MCSITVHFTGSWDKTRPNGPGPFKLGRETIQGLGFTASVVVNKGGIGKIGSDPTPNLRNPGGGWKINQVAWSDVIVNGEKRPRTNPDDIDSTMAGAAQYENPLTGVSEFSWYDHPGYPESGVTSFSGSYTFIITAMNGEQTCAIRFRMEMSLQGNGWSVKWGRMK